MAPVSHFGYRLLICFMVGVLAAGCARAADPSWTEPPATHPGYLESARPPTPDAPARAHTRRPALAASPAASPPLSATPVPAPMFEPPQPADCERELRRRGVPFVRAKPSRGVQNPVRIVGALSGVTVRFAASGRPGTDPVNDVMDCRLAVALSEWAALVRGYGVVEVVHMSMYRPGATIRSSGNPSQHALGLAVDVGELRFSDGTRLVVAKDWRGAIGQQVCSPNAAPNPAVKDGAALLRHIVCETSRRQIFRLILTPNYDAAHRDHFHFDLRPGQPALVPR